MGWWIHRPCTAVLASCALCIRYTRYSILIRQLVLQWDTGLSHKDITTLDVEPDYTNHVITNTGTHAFIS